MIAFPPLLVKQIREKSGYNVKFPSKQLSCRTMRDIIHFANKICGIGAADGANEGAAAPRKLAQKRGFYILFTFL